MWMFLLKGLLSSVSLPSSSPASKWPKAVVKLGISQQMPRFRNCWWIHIALAAKRMTLRFLSFRLDMFAPREKSRHWGRAIEKKTRQSKGRFHHKLKIQRHVYPTKVTLADSGSSMCISNQPLLGGPHCTFFSYQTKSKLFVLSKS